MKNLLAAVLVAAVAAFGFAGSASAAPAKSTPKPVKNSATHKAEAAPASVRPAVSPGPVNTKHPPVVLLVTDVQLQLVWTNVGWVYVQVPVRYYVTAVWNPVYQAYGYYDRAGLYHLYYPPVVVPVPLPAGASK